MHSQEQLAGLLSQYAGMHVTQATLSRDLDELGVVRLRAADGALVYALPGDPGGRAPAPGTAFDIPNEPGRLRPVRSARAGRSASPHAERRPAAPAGRRHRDGRRHRGRAAAGGSGARGQDPPAARRCRAAARRPAWSGTSRSC